MRQQSGCRPTLTARRASARAAPIRPAAAGSAASSAPGAPVGRLAVIPDTAPAVQASTSCASQQCRTWVCVVQHLPSSHIHQDCRTDSHMPACVPNACAAESMQRTARAACPRLAAGAGHVPRYGRKDMAFRIPHFVRSWWTVTCNASATCQLCGLPTGRLLLLFVLRLLGCQHRCVRVEQPCRVIGNVFWRCCRDARLVRCHNLAWVTPSQHLYKKEEAKCRACSMQIRHRQLLEWTVKTLHRLWMGNTQY